MQGRALKRTEHHQRVNIPKCRVMKRLRQTANDLKAMEFPKRHGACVGADDEVELHSAIAALPRVIQGVLTHSASNTATCCSSTRHVPAIADVLAATGLIGTNVVSPDNLAVFLGDEGFPVVPQPIRESVSFGHIAIQRVCLASTAPWTERV